MSPLKLFKYFSGKSATSLEALKAETYPKTYLRTYERVCRIFCNSLLSRDYIYCDGDGLDTLLKKGLYPVLKQVLDLCFSNGKAYILLYFDDVAQDLSQPVGEFSRWELGKVVSHLTHSIHPSRYIVLNEWKSSQDREELRRVCHLFDEAVLLLSEGLNFSLRPYLQLGDLSSLLETRSYSCSEREELKSLLSRSALPKTYLLGKEDSLGCLNPSSSAVGMFRYLASYLSFLTALPLTYLLPEEKKEVDSYSLFYQEIESLSQLLIKPVIQELLQRFRLSSEWQFRELSSLSHKERIESEFKKAQTASLWLETLKSCGGEISQALEKEIYKKAFNFLNRH